MSPDNNDEDTIVPDFNPDLLIITLDKVSEGVFITDKNQNVIYINNAFSRITGFEPADILGKNSDIMQGEFHQQLVDERENLEQALAQGETTVITLKNQRKNGNSFWNQLTLSTYQKTPESNQYLIGIINDISEQVDTADKLVQANRNLKELAVIDSQTGLYNRSHFATHLFRYWREAMREIRPLTLLLIDIDDFADVNTQFGEAFGDDALYRIAYTLKGTLKRASDILARYGDDQFIVLSSSISLEQADDLGLILGRTIAELRFPKVAPDLQITVSVGIAHGVPHAGTGPDAMLGSAQMALDDSRIAGGDCCRHQQI